MKPLLALCLLAAAVALAVSRPAAAAGIRLVGDPAVENHFPDGLTFSMEAESDSPIKDVRLKYAFMPDGRYVTAKPDFDASTRIHATYTLRSGTSQLYIPPGKTIRYSWEMQDADGNELKTDERETSFADTRFKWMQVTDGVVNLNYYRGTQRDAEVMAQVANELIAKATALMGTSFDFPIKIWAYSSPKDFQIALAHSSVTADPNVLGQAHEPDTFIMVVDRLSSPSALDTMRHELTHLVTARALRGGPFKDLYPSWLNEGTSVYMQVSPNDVGYIDSLEKAIQDDTVLPLRTLTSGIRARDVGLFYGESYSVVKFLIDKYGPEKFAQMIAEFKSNGNEDSTFQKVYGLDRDGLYREWRVSVGLKPVPDAARSGSNSDQRSQSSSSGNAESVPVLLIVTATAAMILLAAVAAAGGLLLARRARHGGVE